MAAYRMLRTLRTTSEHAATNMSDMRVRDHTPGAIIGVINDIFVNEICFSTSECVATAAASSSAWRRQTLYLS